MVVFFIETDYLREETGEIIHFWMKNMKKRILQRVWNRSKVFYILWEYNKNSIERRATVWQLLFSFPCRRNTGRYWAKSGRFETVQNYFVHNCFILQKTESEKTNLDFKFGDET